MKEFLIYLGAFIGILAIVVTMAILWLTPTWEEWMHFVKSNIALVAGINFLGVFILFDDKVLLRYFFYKFSKQSLA